MSVQPHLSANTKVRPTMPGPPPEDVKWVKDLRLNPRTRKQLIEGFWKEQRSVSAHVQFVANESDRERLRKEGKVMVLISDLSAQHVTVIVPTSMIAPA